MPEILTSNDFKYIKEDPLPVFSFCEIGEQKDDLVSNFFIDELFRTKPIED